MKNDLKWETGKGKEVDIKEMTEKWMNKLIIKSKCKSEKSK